jgi:hypothetical protein
MLMYSFHSCVYIHAYLSTPMHHESFMFITISQVPHFMGYNQEHNYQLFSHAYVYISAIPSTYTNGCLFQILHTWIHALSHSRFIYTQQCKISKLKSSMHVRPSLYIHKWNSSIKLIISNKAHPQ